MMDFEDQEYQELDEFEDTEEPRRNFGGLSPVEIGVLIVLLVVICGLAGFVGKSVYDNALALAETPTPSPTVVFTPTLPPDATSTPWPTAVGIPDWNKFVFAAEKASLWLPDSFQGGDPIAYPDIVMLTFETYSDDEIFLQSIRDTLADNAEISLLVFDPLVTEWPRMAAASSEKLPSDWSSNKDGYLKNIELDLLADGNRFIGQEYVILDNFEAWRVIAEIKVPVGDEGYYNYSKVVSYLVPVNDVMWTVAYSTGRNEFPEFWPIVKESINTFHVQP